MEAKTFPAREVGAGDTASGDLNGAISQHFDKWKSRPILVVAINQAGDDLTKVCWAMGRLP
ncbi:MAG: hypothetical protein Q8S20_08655 [Sulfuritalea sp.]|nr:hypothetical protein [Sulfuritalea sp.]